ncbi:hypothetical protein KAI54_01680, partial [Candidatus Gracilibacteria bacterium]|nr:hypothetical protein [Candidatus Gracilibacteria bacterium]
MPAANRRAIREAVVQTVFECEFRGVELVERQLAIFEKNIAEFELSFEKDFASALLKATFDHSAEIKMW